MALYVPKVFTVKFGNLTVLEVTLYNPDGSIHDYAGATIFKLNIILWPDSTPLTRTMVPEGVPAAGKLRYTLVAGDWAGGGITLGPLVPPKLTLAPDEWEHRMEYEIDNKFTFPNGGYDILRVLPNLG